MTNLDDLTSGIEQGFMQPGGWKECRYWLGKLVSEKDAEIERLQTDSTYFSKENQLLRWGLTEINNVVQPLWGRLRELREAYGRNSQTGAVEEE